jgi:hypothetical protein
MKTILFAAALALTASTASADIMVADNNQKLAVDCAKDKLVTVSGNHATITLTGTCEGVIVSGNHATVKGSSVRVLVSGNNNTVEIDAADEIHVTGNKNTVSYKKGIKAKAPKVSNPGNNNSVSAGK